MAVHDFLRDFCDTVFVDVHDHRSAEEWRPKWRKALEDLAATEPATVLVLLGAEMVVRRSETDVCHLELQEAYAAGARVVYLEESIAGRDLFEELIAAYRVTGRDGIEFLEGQRSLHRRRMAQVSSDFSKVEEAIQQETLHTAWKAVFDGYVRTFQHATAQAELWAERLHRDCLSDTAELLPLDPGCFIDPTDPTRTSLGSRALIGPSGTGKSRLLARWILHLRTASRLQPYVVLLDAEEVGHGVRALCRILGIPRAESRLREMNYADLASVLAAFHSLLSQNDQERGLVLVIDSLERVVDTGAASVLLRAVASVPHLSVWITCRRSAWTSYDSSTGITTLPIEDLPSTHVVSVLAGKGVDTGAADPPQFLRRAVNLDILAFLAEKRVLRSLPDTESSLLDRYFEFAAQTSSPTRHSALGEVRRYLNAVAAKQIVTGRVRVSAEEVEASNVNAKWTRQRLLNVARILRTDVGSDGKPTVRLRHDRLDSQNLAVWCLERFDDRLPDVVAVAPTAVGLLALGGLYRRLLDRGMDDPNISRKRQRLFEQFLWILDQKAFTPAQVDLVDKQTKALISAASWTVTYVLVENAEASLHDIREALRGRRARSLIPTDYGVRSAASRYDGTGQGEITLEAAVSLASVYRPGRGTPAIETTGTDTTEVFATWIFEKAWTGKRAQRFRFVEALSRFDDAMDSSIQIFRRLFDDGLRDDIELVKALASSVAGRTDAEAVYIRNRLLETVSADEFVLQTGTLDADRLQFLKWYVARELGSPIAATAEVVRGALRRLDAFGKISDWTDIEAGIEALREIISTDPSEKNATALVPALASILGHEHQRVRQAALTALPELIQSRRARASLLSVLDGADSGAAWNRLIEEAIRAASGHGAMQDSGTRVAFLAECLQHPLLRSEPRQFSGAVNALYALHDGVVTRDAIEIRRFDGSRRTRIRLQVEDTQGVDHDDAREIIARHPSADPGPERERKYRLIDLGPTHLTIGRSLWGTGKRFFAAVPQERRRLATVEFDGGPESPSGPNTQIDRKEALLHLTECLARGAAVTPGLLCLHVIVRTRSLMVGEAENELQVPSLVCARRADGSGLYSGARTLSFEEQFTAEDLPPGGSVDEWVANCAFRGFAEEFELIEHPEVLNARQKLAAGTTLRSLILESSILNLAFVATLELPWTRVELEQLLLRRSDHRSSSNLRELTDIETVPLSGEQLEQIASEADESDATEWHPTTAIRARIARRTWLVG